MDTIPVQAPNGLAEVIAHFGDPKFNGIMVDPTWEAANMMLVRDFPLVPAGKLYVHRFIVEPLRLALADCAGLMDNYRLDTIGCYAPRLQRGSTTAVSLHTFGIAVDLNAAANRLQVPRPASPQLGVDYDLPDAWIACFKRRGWFWGGDFAHRWDPMHFQLATGY